MTHHYELSTPWDAVVRRRADTALRAHLGVGPKGWHTPVCGYCNLGAGTTIDHVFPRCYGGTNDVTNLVFACSLCNDRKGTNPAETLDLDRRERRARLIEHGWQRLAADRWTHLDYPAWTFEETAAFKLACWGQAYLEHLQRQFDDGMLFVDGVRCAALLAKLTTGIRKES